MKMSALVMQERIGGVRFSVRVQPRAQRNALNGVHAGALNVKLTAPPVDGAANEALVAMLAAWLDVPERAITIVNGVTSRAKLVEVAGVSAEQVQRRMDGE
jgi:uncharacterized protein (TIGR00251 family)